MFPIWEGTASRFGGGASALVTAALLVLTTVAACGPSGRSGDMPVPVQSEPTVTPTPTPPVPEPTPPAPEPTPPTPTPTPPTPTPTPTPPTPTPPAPTPTPPAPGPTPTPTPPAPTPTPPPAPNLPAACADIVATPGAAIEVSYARGTYATCELATSSPWGQLALGRSWAGLELAIILYSPSGELQGTLADRPSWPTGAPAIDSWFHWTSDGYVGLTGRPPQMTVWDRFGARTALGPAYVIALAPDGHGGTVALTRDPSYDRYGSLRAMLRWLDPWAHQVRVAFVDGAPTGHLVSWTTGHVLTVESSAGLGRARWYDGAGAPLTGWIQLGSAFVETTMSTHLLVDGSIVLGTYDRWRTVLRDGVEQVSAAPAWLSDLPSTRLATVRDGRGYAALPRVNTDEPVQLLTAAGESCGTLALPASPEPGRHPRRVDVGQDGTVIRIEQTADGGCAFRWWPALLR